MSPRIFTLTLVAKPDADPLPGIRQLLKIALRRHGLRCTNIRELIDKDGQSPNSAPPSPRDFESSEGGAMTAGLDFWATDAFTDSQLPMFDDWSTKFLLREWIREINHDWLLEALAVDIVDK